MGSVEPMRRWVRLLSAAALVWGLGTLAASAQTDAAGKLAVPSPAKLLILVRSSLIALNQANLTNDYSVLWALGSPKFQQDNPPTKLAATFEAFRKAKVDVSAVAMVTPQVTKPPMIDAEQQLHILGSFPTSPMQINYVLAFADVDGKWLLSGINLGLTESPDAHAAGPDATASTEPAAAPAPAPVPSKKLRAKTAKAAKVPPPQP